MKAVSKTGLLLAVALVSVCAMAASAQAVTITPVGTAVSGVAANPTFTYGGVPVTCDSGTAVGTTRNPASNAISLTLSFQGTCRVAMILVATVTCKGNVTLRATSTGTSGTFNLDTGFTCTIDVSGVCNIDVEGPQLTGNTGTLNEAATSLTATVTLSGTRTGSSSCGMASGPGVFNASYAVTPTSLTIT
jgi:hypothetical protein